MLRLAPICAALVLAGSAGLAAAQQPTLGTAAPNVKRSTLHKIEVPGSNYDVTFALVDVGANTRLGRHAHPGTVAGYVLEGEYTIAVDGQPERTLKAGDSGEIPPGVVHDEWTGGAPARILVVLTLERGKPSASPAP
jgi:quercetin dioxygenase-like cupin family protein